MSIINSFYDEKNRVYVRFYPAVHWGLLCIVTLLGALHFQPIWSTSMCFPLNCDNWSKVIKIIYTYTSFFCGLIVYMINNLIKSQILNIRLILINIICLIGFGITSHFMFLLVNIGMIIYFWKVNINQK